MEIIGVEPREIAGDEKQVLVVHPTDDGNNGGHFIGATINKLYGQELQLDNLSPEFLEILQADPERAVDLGLVTQPWPGSIIVASICELRLGTQRGELRQDSNFLTPNPRSSHIVLEYGPSIEAAKDDPSRLR